MNDIAIYGAGGFGREIAVMIQQINRVRQEWNLIGYFDDGLEEGERIEGLMVIGGIRKANQHKSPLALILAIADPTIRKKIANLLDNPNLTFPVLAHPQAILGSESNFFGQGSIITANCILTTGIVLGEFVIVNLATTLGHDVKLGSFCSVMPGCNVSGNVTVGEETLIGTGVKILQNISIGQSCVIGAGAVVTRNQQDSTVAVGIPAKRKNS